MAQSVEHVIGNDEVISSNLIISSKNPSQKRWIFCFIHFAAAQSVEHVIGKDDLRSLALTLRVCYANVGSSVRRLAARSAYQLQKSNPIGLDFLFLILKYTSSR